MILNELLSKIGFEVNTKPLDKVRERMDGIEHRLSMLSGIEMARGILEMSERFSGFASNLANTAQASGLGVEKLQGLQLAASQSGSSAEQVTQAMQHLTRTLYDARQGGEEAQQAFSNIGISADQLATFHTTADALGAISDQMAGMSDPLQQQAVAMKFLGGSAASMVPFLQQGSKAMDDAAKSGRGMGAILSGGSVEALKEVEDGIGQVVQVIKVFGATFASYFAPGVRAATRQILGLWSANQALVKTTLREWAEKIMYAFGFVSGVVEGLIIRFRAFTDQHPELVRWGTRVALGLAGIATAASVLAPFMGVLGTALAAVGTVLGVVFSPVGAIIAGLGALVLAVQAAYEVFFKDGKFEDTWLGKVWSGVRDGFADVLRAVLPDFGAAVQSTMVHPIEEVPALLAREADAVKAGPTAHVSPAAAAAVAPQTQNITLTSPITINVPAGTDPTNVGRVVQQTMREHLDKLARETQRDTRTAQVY